MVDFVIVTPDIVGPVKNGGIGTACYHYARTLANAGYSVDILFSGYCASDEAAHWSEKYYRLGITFLTLNDVPRLTIPLHGSRWYSERSHALMEYLRRREDHCILFQDWHANGFWTVRAKQMGTGFTNTNIGIIAHSPTEWQNVGMETFGSSPLDEADLAWTEREAIAGADLLISPSQHMIEWLHEYDFKLPSRIELCPYTFEDNIAQTANSSPDLSHIIFFGRLETRKGLHLLGGALRLMDPSSRPKRVSLLGKYASVEGIPTQDYLEKLFLDLPDIDFTVQTDLDYASAVSFIRQENGLVVMPSTLDNLPLTGIESITNGFHFLASDVGGFPEMVDEAVLFQPTVASLASKLSRRACIDYGHLCHHYSPQHARDVWLRTLDTLLPHKRSLESAETPHSVGEIYTAHSESHASLPPHSSDLAKVSINHHLDGVSICIPFYYHDHYLPRLISAFLDTAGENIQLVFINDGTPEADCPNFHYLSWQLEPLGHVFHTQINSGPGAARNRAVNLAKHERVIFFDCDNVPRPNLVDALNKALSVSGADIVSAPFIAFPAMMRQPNLEDEIFRYHPTGGSIMLGLVDNVLGDTCCITTRKVMDEVGGFLEKRFYIEDWEFYLRAKGLGYHQIVHTDPLFYYSYEDNERRSQISEYMNRKVLLSRLESMEPNLLAKLLRTYVNHCYVSRS